MSHPQLPLTEAVTEALAADDLALATSLVEEAGLAMDASPLFNLTDYMAAGEKVHQYRRARSTDAD